MSSKISFHIRALGEVFEIQYNYFESVNLESAGAILLRKR